MPGPPPERLAPRHRVTQLAQRELDEILATDRHRHGGLGYQVLGLVTASGGGLGDRDLQQLTGRPAFEIDRLLRGVFGRTIAGQAELGVFTHETLREQAIGRLGPDTLAGFAARLHVWADGYRQRRWPKETPEYLLRGYPRMLASAGDAGRLAALAADPARHHRMLDAAGGDAAALAEIAAACALISTSASPDLLAALRLAWQRAQLADRNAHIPVQLPAVWATLGQPVRAEALARSITSPLSQAQALARVATAAAGTGDYNRARELAADAERIARSITSLLLAGGGPGRHGYRGRWPPGTTTAPGSWPPTRSGSPAPASARCGSPARRGRRMAVTAVASAGDYDRAERIARSITSPLSQAEALARVATAAAGTGDYDRARELAADAERIARSSISPNGQARPLAGVATAVASAGDYDRARELAADAERIARSSTMPKVRAWDLAGVATAVASAGDYGRAERIVRSITSPSQQAHALAAVATAAAGTGDYDRARELAADAERIARSSTMPKVRAWDLAGVATAVASAGDYGRAERIVRSITSPPQQAHALAAVATAAAGTGDYDRARELAADAERIVRSSTCPDEQVYALARVATAAAGTGDYDRARELAADAERIARSITSPEVQALALARVAAAAAGTGDYDRARELAADAERIVRLPASTHSTRCMPWPAWPRRPLAPGTTTAPGSWPPTRNGSPAPSPARRCRRMHWPTCRRRWPASAISAKLKASPGPSPSRTSRCMYF